MSHGRRGQAPSPERGRLRQIVREWRPSAVTLGAPILPLAVLFGLNAVDELDRTAFAVLRAGGAARRPRMSHICGASPNAHQVPWDEGRAQVPRPEGTAVNDKLVSEL